MMSSSRSLSRAEEAASRGNHYLEVIARMKPGIRLQQAQVEMETIAARLAQEYPKDNTRIGATVRPLQEEIVGDMKPALLVLLGAVAFVLLIACANVANLLLARAAGRQKEIAVRLALGADRLRLTKQLLVESVLLSLLGGGVGLLLASAGLRILTGFIPAGVTQAGAITIDAKVLAFTVGVALLTGLIFGLAPASQTSHFNLNDTLKEGGRDSGSGVRGNRIRSTLVIAEVAVSLVLLIGAGLLMNSFRHLQTLDPGFRVEHLLTMKVPLSEVKYPGNPERTAFFDEVVRRVAPLPGVKAVAIAGNLPFTYNGDSMPIGVEGIPDPPPDQHPDIIYRAIGEGYFSAMGIPLVRGRDFTRQDTLENEMTVIVSEKTARHYWPEADPIGKRLKAGSSTSDGPWRTVIGVVKDVRQNDFIAAPKMQMYFTYRQLKSLLPNALIVRTAVDPASLATAVRNQIWAIDKDQPVSDIRTMDDIIRSAVARQRFSMLLLGIFAALALVLAAVGIYGVMSYSVAQRTREIGLRMALGAQRIDVLKLAVGQALRLVLAGLALGLVAALLLTRLMASLLFRHQRHRSAHLCRLLARLARGRARGQLHSCAARDPGRSDGGAADAIMEPLSLGISPSPRSVSPPISRRSIRRIVRHVASASPGRTTGDSAHDRYGAEMACAGRRARVRDLQPRLPRPANRDYAFPLGSLPTAVPDAGMPVDLSALVSQPKSSRCFRVVSRERVRGRGDRGLVLARADGAEAIQGSGGGRFSFGKLRISVTLPAPAASSVHPMSDSTETIDPAASDEQGVNARNGAAKRRDPNEPVAVVGLGASAGGVSVLQQFFQEMPAESGLAFVVVMHLSPEYESNLAAVLQQKTDMPVMQVNEPIRVRPNHVYVIPPNHQLTFKESTLQLVPPQQAQGRRVTIDLFFRTLAQAYGQRAVCVILSGSDSDGVIGLKHVRAQGGVTIAQDPNEAEHESMPVSAISTGMVDWVLPVAKMPAKLMEFVANESRMRLPPEFPEAEQADIKDQHAPGGETVSEETREEADETAIGEVLAHLRGQTGHDFSHYKRATVLRRIARRLQVNSLESIPQYLDFIRQHPAESRALLQDLLIGVTHFFRDRAAFAAVEANIPQLFAGKRKEDQLRIWVAGCATGEEAYSLAILLCEYADRLERPPSIQIFASDVDDQAIQDARDGLYPATIEADVSQERLRRFFAKDHGRYRVRKELREKVLFAAHDLLKDPPFSRIDLVSCRNLLIYLTPKAQDLVFDIFHFALRAGGLLFVGGSESGNNVQALFAPVDAANRIYVRRSVPRPSWRIPILPGHSANSIRPSTGGTRVRALPPMTRADVEQATVETPESLQTRQERRAVLFGELHLKLLEEYGPPSVVVNEAHDIVHLSENAGRYLKFAAGEPSANIMTVVHPALRIELRTALFRAAQGHETVKCPPQLVEIDHTAESVSLHVRPVQSNDPARGFFLILFEKQETVAAEVRPAPHDDFARELEGEVQYLKDQLNSTVEQYEAANEELKASNEELQAANEEMRSATEELETSKEELQSVNEELVTVNSELKDSVENLSRANTDLDNLMASTDIGTIFLDRQLRIQRFTPSAQKIFHLLPADLGRPLSDITHQLSYDALIADAEGVLENLATVEHEVRAGENGWFLLRLAPYRTAEDRIAGVVGTFIDITRRKKAEGEVRASEARWRQAFETDTVGVFFFTVDGRIVDCNEAFLRMSGYSRGDLEEGRMRWDQMTPPEFMDRSLQAMAEYKNTGEIPNYEKQYIRKDGSRWWGMLSATRLTSELGVKFVLDITEKKEAEHALRASEERFRQFAENSADVFWIVDAGARRVEYVNPAYDRIWGEARANVLEDTAHWLSLVHPDDRKHAAQILPTVMSGQTACTEYRIIRPSDGAVRWIRDTGFPIADEEGRITRVAGVAQDITEDKERVNEVRAAEERFRLLVEGAPDYAMFLLDPDNTITYWSSGAEKVFGWSAAEAIGQTGELIFTPEDRARHQVEKEISTAREKGFAPDRRWHLRKDGSRLWVDGVMRRVDGKDGRVRGFAKIARDATEQRQIDQALSEARDELEQRVLDRTRDLRATNTELERAMSQRQELEKELLEISEREKRRVGEDLHDMICQELTATALFLKSTAKRLGNESPPAAETLEEAAQIVNRNVGLARDLARGLQPADLKGSGLKQALRSLAEQACENSDLKCHFKATRGARVTDDTIALHLYRVAQEALKNSIKHSGASNVLIILDRSDTHVCVIVQDDGKGFSPKRRTKGLGLHIMRYRANALGGELRIEKRRTGGTEIICTIPMKR